MKPPPFAYCRPTSVGETAEILATVEDASVLAGGQSLIPLLNLRLARPALVVDLSRCAGLDDVSAADGVLDVGARVTAAELASHPAVFAGLSEAVLRIGHPQIRSRTTIGGSIAHADPSAELPTVLAGCGGAVVLTSVRGTREVAATDFFDGPFSTTRAEAELVVSVRFPIPDGPSTFLEVARRSGDFAIVGLYAQLHGEASRFAASGAGPTAVAASSVDELMERIDPSDDIHASADHRRHLVRVLAHRSGLGGTVPA